MGNLPCGFKDQDESAWKQQNKEMVQNPAYRFADLAKGGKLIEAYENDGPARVEEIARREMCHFFYHENGDKHRILEDEFIRWQYSLQQRIKGFTVQPEKVSMEKLRAEYVEDYFNKFVDHDACWDINKRGGVGETPFHLLYLMDSPVHFEVARILLKIYPNLSLDVYEGEEYYGESALHIAIVVGDMESVQLLVKAGADVNQRASGRFFLPEDQKQGYTGNTNYEGYAYYGEYPLAFAACLGNTDMYDFLLANGANPNLQDSFGNTVLHMVVISDQADMYKYAVRHHRSKADTSIKNNQNLTPLTLACKLGRPAIFKEMLDLDSIDFWRFSTTMCSAHPLRTLDSIGPDGSTNWNSALMIIVNGETDDHLEMLEGGVMRQLLDEKWKTFAKNRFIKRLIVAIIHLALLSVAIYTRPKNKNLLGYRGPVDAIRYTAEIIVVISCAITIFYEVTEISTQGLSSFFKNCTHAPAQTVYLISCLLIVACIPFRFLDMHKVEDILMILAAPCSWFFILFFARGAKLTGPFVTMIYKMCAGDMLRFAIIYCIFLVSFTLAFFFLFRDVELQSATNSNEVAKFSTVPETVLYLFQMTLGEFKYEIFDFSHFSPLTKLIFALFMILVPILLLNMLIAMMGNTYTTVIQKSSKEWRKQWAKIVVVLERGISNKKLLEFQKAYSVKLSGGPPDPDGKPPPPEERALVVIKTSSKSRAKTRKQATYRWKYLGKEIIRQLRQKKARGEPFELTESMRRGQTISGINDMSPGGINILSNITEQLAWERDIDLTKGQPPGTGTGFNSPSQRSPALSERIPKMRSHSITNEKEQGADLITSAVAQLAWEKDIDLTKGQPPSPVPDSFSSQLAPHQATSSSVPNGSAVTKGTDQNKKIPDIPMTQLRKKKNMNYNRVSPLLHPVNVQEESPFSDLSDDGGKDVDYNRQAESVFYQYPPHLSEEEGQAQRDERGGEREGSPTRNVVFIDESNNRIIQSEFALSADSSSASESKHPELKYVRSNSKYVTLLELNKRVNNEERPGSSTPTKKSGVVQSTEVEVQSSTSSLQDVAHSSTLSVSQDIVVRDIETPLDTSRDSAQYEATGTTIFSVESSGDSQSSPTRRRKGKGKKRKVFGSSQASTSSSSSVKRLVESEGSGSRDEPV